MESTDNVNNLSNSTEENSVFTGGMLANYFIGLATMLVSLITLGLAYPAMVCWKLKWETSHTYLNGQQLTFDGKAMQLMGKYVLWMFLSIITFGLYYIFSAKLKLTEWQTKHTHFANYQNDDENVESKFNGKWYQLFAVNFVCRFVTIITLFIGYYWAHCYKERWYCKHKTIDGCELTFDGRGMQYFGKRIIWTLLTIVTLGIYSFWLQIKSIKWTVSHTNLVEIPNKEKECISSKVVIGKNMIEIGDRAFYASSTMNGDIVISSNVKRIGEYAFYKCNGLTSIVIPKSVKSIGWAAFYGCGELTIYCQAESAPKNWNGSWDYSDTKISVVWGYK